MAYLLVIFLSAIIIYIPNALANVSHSDNPWLYYFLAVLIYTVACVVIDGLVAFIVRRLPEKLMNPKKGMIYTRPWEGRLYKAIHVDSWKKFMPDLGMFTKFQKGHIADPKNPEYIKRYILEASYGVVIHYLSVPFSLLVLLLGLIEPANLATWTVGVPVVFVNMILILLPALSLKYNIPKLIRINEMNEKLLAKKLAKEKSDRI